MAKRLLVLVLIAGAGYLVYRQMSVPPTEEETMVQSVRDRYAVAVNKFLSAAGRSGAIGMDTTLDSEAAAVQILKLRDELAGLRKTLTEEKALRKAEELADKIDYFCKKNDIIRP